MIAKMLENVSAAMDRNFEQNRVAASQILITRHGKLEFCYKTGFMDVENHFAVPDDAIYRIYSMSKPITMTAIMRLVERGKIFLEDPVCEYIPEFRDTPVAVALPNGVDYVNQSPRLTVKNLLTMTSGISYPGDEDWGARSMAKLDKGTDYRKITTLDLVRRVGKGACLSFQPGERWKYGFSHDVVGALVEIVSGMRFGDYLKREIFDPLGMTDTAFTVPEDKVARFCHAYTVKSGKFKRLVDRGYNEAYLEKCTFESGGGGLVSTAKDYARFCQAMLNYGTLDGYRLLGRKTVEMMSTNQLDERQMATFNWRERGYGYGLGMRVCLYPWMVNGSVGEFGWDGMMGTYMAVDPKEDMTIVYMQNMYPHVNYGFKLLPMIYAAID